MDIRRGLSEASVAVAVHHYLDKEQNEEVRTALAAMQVCIITHNPRVGVLHLDVYLSAHSCLQAQYVCVRN